jgi:hypothetical protein
VSDTQELFEISEPLLIAVQEEKSVAPLISELLEVLTLIAALVLVGVVAE